MGVDYKKQYRPDQLEPFWPHEIIKMVVAVLCTLALLMLLVILPVLLDAMGIHGMGHEAQPANPQGATPVGIKPEWYFLATYQYLRVMPTQFLGIGGKTWGVLSQGPIMLAILLLPFWYRRYATQKPCWTYRLFITACIFGMLLLTIWGGWPEIQVDGHEQMMPLGEYLKEQRLFFILMALSLTVFYLLISRERKVIRTILSDQDPANPKGDSKQ